MPSDPSRLSSTQVSFRLRLAGPVASLIDAPPVSVAPYADSFGRPYASMSYGGRPGLVRAGIADSAPAARRRKARVTAVTWSGQAAPGDVAATQLLDAVRLHSMASATIGGGAARGGPGGAPRGAVGLVDAEATQPLDTVPGWDDEPVGGRRYGSQSHHGPSRGGHPHSGHPHGGHPYGGVPRQASGGGRPAPSQLPRPSWQPAGELPEHSATVGEPSRHAWYPGRRVDLGLVLLPMRVLLGSLSVFAGMSKLCDPVYFDGGDRGSMMRWLSSLHPWKAAQPLLDLAMAHPVGAGLGVAFIEVVVGVLTLLGLWQRLAAGASMLLSAALLFTVSWRAVPAYDTPDLILLAAWSPLLIAGAPYASLDGRLALEAWRRYGPQAPGAVRRRVLRRGGVVATVVIGVSLLFGSLLGAAVRGNGHPEPTQVPPSDYGTPVWPAVTGAPSTGTTRPHTPGTPSAGHSAPSGAGTSSAPSGASSAVPSAPSAAASATPSSGSRRPTHPAGSARATEGTGSTATQGSGPAGSAGAGTPGNTPGGAATNRAPKEPSPSGGGGLIGGVLGSGLLPGDTLGMRQSAPAPAPRPVA